MYLDLHLILSSVPDCDPFFPFLNVFFLSTSHVSVAKMSHLFSQPHKPQMSAVTIQTNREGMRTETKLYFIFSSVL